MEYLGSVFQILSPFASRIATHATYPFKVGENVRALKDAAEKLVAKRKDIGDRIGRAEREGLSPTNQVNTWLEQVKDDIAEVEEIKMKYGDRRCRLLQDCSIDLWSNYAISKSAAKKLADVRQKEIDGGAIDVVAVKPPPPPVQELPVASAASPSPSLDLALRYIRDDTTGMIGIAGMGGVGKTHLLKQINNFFLQNKQTDNSFDVVIFVTASSECSVAKIQDQIMKRLGLARDNENESKSDAISGFLSKRSFLLLLDDLWGRLDLEAVGIPMPLGLDASGEHKRKVALTTRSTETCGQMNARKTIQVARLNEESSRRLFRENAFEEAGDDDPLVRPLAEQVVKELNGLPLALILVGRAMHGKKDPAEWERAVDQLRKSRLDEIEAAGTDESTFHKLKLSYDSLSTDALRECFLCCSLWPEDHEIDKDELIECWLGLGLIEIDEFDDVPGAYGEGSVRIGKLKRAHLLEGDDPEEVKMHDVVRDMALWLARDQGKSKNKWVVQAGQQLREAPKDGQIWRDAERISLMYNMITKLSPPIISPPAKLTALMLKFNNILGTIDSITDNFITLTYLDLSWNGLSSFPLEICKLVNLRYLNLWGNRIDSLPEELGSLANLKFLDLSGNPISTVPNGVISKLEALQMLDLRPGDASTNLHYLPSLFEELKGLNDLKALGILIQDMSQFRRLVELPNAPIRSLGISKLTQVTSLPFSAGFLGNVQIQKNLVNFTIADSDVEEIVIESRSRNPSWHFHKLEVLYIRSMRRLKGIIWGGLMAKDLFSNLRRLTIFGCDELADISWVLHLPRLRQLNIVNCRSMEKLISSEGTENSGEHVADRENQGGISFPSFPCLRSIFLCDLQELDSICDPTFRIPHLESFEVRGCPKLKKLPFRHDNIPGKLKSFKCGREWWGGLEWEDDSIRSSVQPLLEEKVIFL